MSVDDEIDDLDIYLDVIGLIHWKLTMTSTDLENPRDPSWAMVRYYLQEYPGAKKQYLIGDSCFLHLRDRKLALWWGSTDALNPAELESFIRQTSPCKGTYFSARTSQPDRTVMQLPGARFTLEGVIETWVLPLGESARQTRLPGPEYSVRHHESHDSNRVEILHRSEVVCTCETGWRSMTYAEIGGETNKDHRGMGLFPVAVAHLAGTLHIQQIVPLYMLESSNTASRRVAQKLGFRDTGGRELTFYLDELTPG